MKSKGWVRTVLEVVAILVVSTSFGSALYAQETVRRALPRDTVINGVPCARTKGPPAEFYASGRLLECPLSRDATIATHLFPKDSWVLFHENGTLDAAWLSRHAQLSGQTCKGTGYKAWSVRFHTSGALRSCYFPVNTVVEGVPCREGTFWGEIRGGQRNTVYFHANGKLARCQASRAFTLNGVKYDKWDVVVRDSVR